MDKVLACILTVVIEAAVMVCFRKKFSKETFAVLIISSIPLNIETNLGIHFLLESFIPFGFWIYLAMLLILETLVVLIEGFTYQAIIREKRLAWKISFISNLASFVIGSLVLYILLKFVFTGW